jgi:hypothetical protein
MVAETVKKFVLQYLMLTGWFLAYQEDKDRRIENLQDATREISRIEDILKKSGYTESDILELRDISKKLITTPISQWSPDDQAWIYKFMFGGGEK